MTNVLAGRTAPQIELDGAAGKRFSLNEVLKQGPAVIVFFKITCPVCQFTFPFLERLYQRYGKSATFRGISQDDARDTKDFAEEFGVTFPLLLDDERNYPVSNLYGVTNVPTVLLVAPDGKVKVSFNGFDKAGLEQIATELAAVRGEKSAPLFKPDEVVPSYKPG